MTETVFKAPKAKKSPTTDDDEVTSSVSKRPRTAEDFYLFCKFILEYENYEQQQLLRESTEPPDPVVPPPIDNMQQEICEKAGSPMGSTGSMTESIKSESPADVPDERKSSDTEEDSYDLVTCYCTKPFAGRPMIECSKCLTWIHLSCAKIKKTNIPEVFICVKCKHRKFNSVSSNSSVRHKKRVSV